MYTFSFPLAFFSVYSSRFLTQRMRPLANSWIVTHRLLLSPYIFTPVTSIVLSSWSYCEPTGLEDWLPQRSDAVKGAKDGGSG